MLKIFRKMGQQRNMPRIQLNLNCFVGYVIIFSKCCITEIASSDSSDINITVISFTEDFIMKHAGRKVDVKMLLKSYSSVCPLQERCGVDIDNKLLIPDELLPKIAGCYRCTCNPTCAIHGNCCPSAHYGYVNYSCVNVNLYPKTTEESVYMIGTCLDSYSENKTVIDMCRDKVEPCTGTETNLIYKNKYCGKCNKEFDCVSLKIKVECANATAFEKMIPSFTSPIDMKKALELHGCRIAFEHPKAISWFPCNDSRDYLSIMRVERCNVSGFWDDYDEDIDWACTNFIIPYKHFKNVFCYICNPSHGSMEAVTLIENCRPPVNDLEAKVNRACQSFPIAKRLAPFKNIYCYVCNQGHELLFEDKEYSLQYVEEDNNLDLQTRLDIAITFSGANNFKDFKTFAENLLPENFVQKREDETRCKSKQLTLEASDVIKVLTDYISVCGTETLCNKTITRNKTDKIYGNPVCKTCTCNTFCAENESCCPDILFTREPYACYSPGMFSSFHKYKDVESKFIINTTILQTDSYLTIDICVNDSHVPSNNSCSVVNDTSDPGRLSRIPVSTDNGMTYKNIYCYECNNNKSAITLKFQVKCETYIEHTLFTKVKELLNTIILNCNEISFVPVRNKICSSSFDTRNASLLQGEKFVRRELHPSQFEFKVRTYEGVKLTDLLKPVRNVFDKCNKTGMYSYGISDLVTDVCEKDNVNLMSLFEYRIDNNVYKNFACFLCNPEYDSFTVYSENVTSRCLSNNSVEWYVPNETLEELCNVTELHPRWYPHKNMYCAECNLPPWQLVDVDILTGHVLPATGYKYIFSLSSEEFEHLDKVMETEAFPDCPNGSYDYALKQCRSLSCNEGFHLFNTTCKPILEYAIQHEYSLSFDLHYSSGDKINVHGNNETDMTIMVSLETLISKIEESLTNSFGETTEYLIKDKEYLTSPCVSVDNIDYVDLVKTFTVNIHFTILIIKTETISMVNTALVYALNRQFNISDIMDIDRQPKTILIHSKPESKEIDDKLDYGACFHFQFSEDFKITSLQFREFTIDAFFTCAQVKLNTSEVYFDMYSKIISLKTINATFSVWEYKTVNKNVIICADVYNTRTFVEPDIVTYIRTDYIKSVFIIFSFICTVISLLCLFLTFITYCFISSLRTIAGKNIMALCVSLFISQALLQFGINATQIKTLCIAIGVSIHLFCLFSFCAMNICSYHTFKVFFYDFLNSRPTTHNSENSSFLKYLFYMICFPVLMVLVTIATSLIKTDASDIGYGKYYCFISDFYIFIFTFITPASLIFVSNIVFFSMAFHKIRSAPNVQGTRERNHFYICIRLCTIVGIAWPLLIIDSSLGITWFSFIAAGVNSLQGVFIFVSFIFNRRVALTFLSSLMEKIGKDVSVTDTRGSSSNSKNYAVKIEETT